jgi:hypothetical protein
MLLIHTIHEADLQSNLYSLNSDVRFMPNCVPSHVFGCTLGLFAQFIYPKFLRTFGSKSCAKDSVPKDASNAIPEIGVLEMMFHVV